MSETDTDTPFSTVMLSAGHAAQTLPLAQVTWPDLDLAHWRKFIQSFTARAASPLSGILALRDASDYFSAMLAFRAEPDVRQGRVLTVQLFTAVGLANSPILVERLLAAAEAKARYLGCSSVEIRLYRAQSNLAIQLRSFGLVETAAIVSRPVEFPASA